MKTLKIKGYDKFKCIADKCKFTCCSGWDINIDNKTYEKLSNENTCKYILKGIKVIDDNNIIINKRTDEECPFLDNIGLCEIVKNHGDDYLSLTCRMFPRNHNVFEEIEELTLSCACPEVVDIISQINGKISLDEMKDNDINKKEDLPIEMKIRNTIVNIIQDNELNLQDKLITSYDMLMSILNFEELTEENVLTEIEKYQNRYYIDDFKKQSDKEINYNISIRTLNNLLLDFIENYKRVPVLQRTLRNISKNSMKIYRGQITLNELYNQWEKFINDFNNYDLLLENCVVSKVLANCINEDIEEIAISLQLTILEYILVRYSTFINVYTEDNVELLQNIKDNIVVFSRIIGNNSNTVIDFIEDQFGDIFLDNKYLNSILM